MLICLLDKYMDICYGFGVRRRALSAMRRALSTMRRALSTMRRA